MEQFIHRNKTVQLVKLFLMFFEKGQILCTKILLLWKRKAQVLHTRLRTGCSSPAKSRPLLKNISVSPMCHCGSIENTQHFFLHCNWYLEKRTLLINSVANFCTPTLHVLLHGDPSLSEATNASIHVCKHVHGFIIDSKRL